MTENKSKSEQRFVFAIHFQCLWWNITSITLFCSTEELSYVGCYKDHHEHVMTGSETSGDKMTARLCVGICTQQVRIKTTSGAMNMVDQSA